MIDVATTQTKIQHQNPLFIAQFLFQNIFENRDQERIAQHCVGKLEGCINPQPRDQSVGIWLPLKHKGEKLLQDSAKSDITAEYFSHRSLLIRCTRIASVDYQRRQIDRYVELV